VSSAEPKAPGVVTWEHVQELMDQLKQRARALLAREGNAGTVHATQLVNSALKKLVPKARDWQEITWEDRGAFFKDANFAMRRCLVDYARRRKRRAHVNVQGFESENVAPLVKSGALDLNRLVWDAAERTELAEALTAALEELEDCYQKQRLADVVQFDVFYGLTQIEIARLMEVDVRTVRNRQKLAYALLREALAAFY
jgi:RNA polymerase sigma factor (sigma-70 family)